MELLFSHRILQNIPMQLIITFLSEFLLITDVAGLFWNSKWAQWPPPYFGAACKVGLTSADWKDCFKVPSAAHYFLEYKTVLFPENHKFQGRWNIADSELRSCRTIKSRRQKWRSFTAVERAYTCIHEGRVKFMTYWSPWPHIWNMPNVVYFWNAPSCQLFTSRRITRIWPERDRHPNFIIATALISCSVITSVIPCDFNSMWHEVYDDSIVRVSCRCCMLNVLAGTEDDYLYNYSDGGKKNRDVGHIWWQDTSASMITILLSPHDCSIIVNQSHYKLAEICRILRIVWFCIELFGHIQFVGGLMRNWPTFVALDYVQSCLWNNFCLFRL